MWESILIRSSNYVLSTFTWFYSTALPTYRKKMETPKKLRTWSWKVLFFLVFSPLLVDVEPNWAIPQLFTTSQACLAWATWAAAVATWAVAAAATVAPAVEAGWVVLLRFLRNMHGISVNRDRSLWWKQQHNMESSNMYHAFSPWLSISGMIAGETLGQALNLSIHQNSEQAKELGYSSYSYTSAIAGSERNSFLSRNCSCNLVYIGERGLSWKEWREQREPEVIQISYHTYLSFVFLTWEFVWSARVMGVKNPKLMFKIGSQENCKQCIWTGINRKKIERKKATWVR